MSTILDSNVINSNVQSVATFAIIGGAINEVGVSNFIARYLLPHEKVRKLRKVTTHLEALGITNDLRKVGCPFTFLDVVPLDVEQYLVTLLQRGSCTDSAELLATSAKIERTGLRRDSVQNSSKQYLMSPSIHLSDRHRFLSRSHLSISDSI